MTITCPECSFTYPIAKSKRTNQCPNCASIAKTGKSLREIEFEKHQYRLAKMRQRSMERQAKKPKTAYKIPKVSAKGAKQSREIKKVKTEIKRAAVETGFGECEGCGNFFDTLDCSHTVPLSQSSELASVPGNIRLLCRECHNAWEGNGTVAELIALRCFIPDMRHLFDLDLSRFYNILGRLVNEYNLRPTPKLEMVLGKIEKFEQ